MEWILELIEGKVERVKTEDSIEVERSFVNTMSVAP